MVLYLGKTPGAEGGATRFLYDSQDGLAYDRKDFSDWTRQATDDDIALRVDGQAGEMLVFDHRLLHDSEILTGRGTKTIIRTDIIYERVGP